MIYNKNMKSYDVCIIGAGASGSLASILLAQKGLSVCLIDKFEKPAKKILVTGNGRCNITNKNMCSDYYNQNIDGFFSKFGYQDTVKLFNSFGLDIYADQEGRCYPISNSAKSVQTILINQIQKHNVNFLPNTQVLDIERNGEKFIIIICDNSYLICKNVIFACGINDFSKQVLNKFNIKCNKIIPSLCALKTKQNTKILDGVRISNVLVTAQCGNNTMLQQGEVLFKEHGLSGICIFNLSSLFAKNKHFEGKICINLLKNHSKSQIFEMINERLHIFEDMQMLLESMFEPKLAKYILAESKLNKDIKTKDIDNQKINIIVDNITNLQFDVADCYNNNQVYSGGVDLSELTQNLQSKTVKGLYFCGEICDVDGICGGYNLQWAWTSASIVAESILKK